MARNSVFAEETTERSIRVKICGITNATDALDAIAAGADALGFNFFPPSPRYIDISTARTWLSELPREIVKIAVLVNPTLAETIELAQMPFIDALQLHGNESPDFCAALAERGIAFAKAVPVGEEGPLAAIPSFSTRTILLDSCAAGFGGSGRTFPWESAATLVKARSDLRVVLAGGLTPENVASAIRQVLPFGVDVTSGVERSPGHKDPHRVQAFIEAARGSFR